MDTRDLKYRDKTWDLQYADTKEYTHCFHTYPAMMIPQIARKLLAEVAGETATTMHEENIVICQRTTYTC